MQLPLLPRTPSPQCRYPRRPRTVCHAIAQQKQVENGNRRVNVDVSKTSHRSGLGIILAVLVSLLASHLMSRRLRSLLARAKAMADGHDDDDEAKPDGADEASPGARKFNEPLALPGNALTRG